MRLHMGWDASATLNGEPIGITADSWCIEHLPYKNVFHEIANRVIAEHGSVGSWVSEGMLSRTHERREFERAFQIKFDELAAGLLVWSPEELIRNNARARWTPPAGDGCDASFWSVKLFVDACIEHDLGVLFSY